MESKDKRRGGASDPTRGMTPEELQAFCKLNPGHPACLIEPPPPDDPPG